MAMIRAMSGYMNGARVYTLYNTYENNKVVGVKKIVLH